MREAILSADIVNTVSPTYAKEILTKEFGAGMEKSLQKREKDLYGIVNGLDYQVLKMKEVDAKLTTSNNLFEIASVLGIEAARQAIIHECIDVLENQGLDIDIRHIMFLAELMTHTGNIRGITRGGISGEKESVLARASFETPIKHLVHASLTGEMDEIKSVIENVMINQPIPLGTGLPILISEVKKEKKIK